MKSKVNKKAPELSRAWGATLCF